LKATSQVFLKAATVGMTVLTAGCATVSSVVEEVNYPRDTAITVGKYHYLINTEKCADATRISSDGEIDCRAADGSKSSSITPFAQWRVNALRGHLKMEWGSPEHQAFLYDFHYKGGKERMAQALVGSVLMVAAVTNAMKTTNYGSLPAGTGPNYGSYPELKKLSVWDARQFDIANWSLNNSILYDFGNGMLANRNGFAGRKIGDFTYYDNGLREYSMGSTSYFSNGTRSIQVTETITVISNGQTCNNISGIRICR